MSHDVIIDLATHKVCGFHLNENYTIVDSFTSILCFSYTRNTHIHPSRRASEYWRSSNVAKASYMYQRRKMSNCFILWLNNLKYRNWQQETTIRSLQLWKVKDEKRQIFIEQPKKLSEIPDIMLVVKQIFCSVIFKNQIGELKNQIIR